MVKLAWLAISAPWSQVIDRRSSAGQRGDGLAHRGVDAVSRAAVLEVEQQDESGAALDEGADGAAAALAQDDVALPVAGHGTVVDLGGSFGDVHHPGQPASAVAVPRFGGGVRPDAQASGQLAAQLAAALHEQRLIDRLVAHPHLRVVGEVQL